MAYDTINDAVTMRPGGGAALGRIDQYELVRELGGGGFGTVYLARDTVAGVEVAVKGLPPFVKNNREEMENIRRNFALVSRLHHPNIAAALVLHPAKDVSYAYEEVRQKLRVVPGDALMVMEYAPGVTLSQWRRQFPDCKVPMDKSLGIVRQVAAALDYAHERKIVHRDVKPANVMVETSADGGLTARVLDFGLAAEIRSSMGRVSREIRDTSGTRPYMAPEQWLGGRQGPATDQYALAVLFYELATGEVPFASVFDTGDPVVMMNVVGREPFVPPEGLAKPVRLALAKALAKKPEDRFASCGEFVAALDGKVKVSRGGAGARSGGSGVGKALGVLALLAALCASGYYGWTKYDESVKACKAEEARVRQEVYELKGKASQARDISGKEEWHAWPHFGPRAKELEGAFLAGEFAFDKDDYAAARMQFLKVRDTWMWLSSNKVERGHALAAQGRADAARKVAEASCAVELAAAAYSDATNAFSEASRAFDGGLFPNAALLYAETARKFNEFAIAAKAESERIAEEKRKAEREEREKAARIAAEKRAEEERKARALAEKRKVNQRVIALFKSDKWEEGFANLSDIFSDDPELDYQLGRAYSEYYKRRDYRKAREYYRKAAQRISIPSDEMKKVEEEALFEIVGRASLEEVKAEINSSNTGRSICHNGHYTLMHHAAHKRDSRFLAYLNSLGYAVDASKDLTGKTPLFYACANTNQADSLGCVDWLLSHGADCNAKVTAGTSLGYTAIFHARRLDVFKRFLESGADLDVLDKYGRTVLHEYAEWADDVELVKFAIAKCKGKINHLSDRGESVVHSAIRISHFVPEVLETLLENGARADVVVRGPASASDVGFAPLHKALYWNRAKAVEILLRHGANANQPVGSGSKYFANFKPIHLLAKKGWRNNGDEIEAVVNALVRHGANVNERCVGFQSDGFVRYRGETPLHLAAKNCNASLIVSALVANGADVHATMPDGKTVLHMICSYENMTDNVRDAIEVLLKAGANPNAVISDNSYQSGFTPLIAMAESALNEKDVKYRKSTLDCVKLFASHGADLEMKNRKGETALLVALEKNRCFVAEALIDARARIDVRNSDGRTPLHLAARAHFPDIVKKLINAGADVNARDKLSETPLFKAVEFSSSDSALECVRALLDNGARPNIKNEFGKGVLDELGVGDHVRRLVMSHM